ncbi:hypothetical protein C8R47DRAFT_1323077 [Mycena vitilis]|nr:hypothetical protein C8R47DRAFT_1323077 [Mycena vitilis]
MSSSPKNQIPDSFAEYLSTALPDTSLQHRRDAFNDAVKNEGSVEAAVAWFKRIHDVVTSGAVIGARSPPANAQVKTIDVGPFTIFYHSTFPPHLLEKNVFTWNFYIGLRGQGVDSIMQDWVQQGIVFTIPTLGLVWEDCQLLTILPSTRVRLTYHEPFEMQRSMGEGMKPGRAQVTHELIFPPDPQDSSITLHYL